MGVVPAVIQEMQRGICVGFGIESAVESGLGQCQTKEFALAGAVFDQEDGGVRHHYIEGYQQGMCRLEDEERNDLIVIKIS